MDRHYSHKKKRKTTTDSTATSEIMQARFARVEAVNIQSKPWEEKDQQIKNPRQSGTGVEETVDSNTSSPESNSDPYSEVAMTMENPGQVIANWNIWDDICNESADMMNLSTPAIEKTPRTPAQDHGHIQIPIHYENDYAASEDTPG